MTQEDKIIFSCEKQHLGVIPEPYAAKKYMPKWFKALPPKMIPEGKEGPGGLHASTVKRCVPFLDSMTAGWIIPCVADVSIDSNEDCSVVSWDTDFPTPVIESHSMDQVGNRFSPLTPLKFINYWKINVPDGYSLLFVPPLNRPNDYFECFSGIVDSDNYHDKVNFPFLFFRNNWRGIIKRGTPLVQVIPIKNNTIFTESEVRAIEGEEEEAVIKHRARRNSQESYYKDDLATKKW